jgi:hypothetical protein
MRVERLLRALPGGPEPATAERGKAEWEGRVRELLEVALYVLARIDEPTA